MEKKIVVKAIIAWVLLVFIANILLAFIFPHAPSFWEILLLSVTHPLVLTPAMGGGLWLILSELGKRETAIPDRYRIYLMFILTVIALLSIQFLSMKVIQTPQYEYNPTQFEYNSSIIPPIIVVSAVTIFVAVTTYMRRYYPYSAIFASALLGVVYLTALPYIYITPEYEYSFWTGVPYYSIPVFVIVSAWWAGEKMGVAYPIAYSFVLGIVAGVALPRYYAGWEMLSIVGPTVFLAIGFGIFTVISFLTKSKSESGSKYFIPALKVTISLIVFFIIMRATYSYIFQPYYNPLGLTSN